MPADAALLQPPCPPSERPQLLLDPTSTVHGLRAAQARLDANGQVRRRLAVPRPSGRSRDPGRWKLVPPPGGASVSVVDVAAEAIPTPHLALELAGLPEPARYRLEVDPPGTVAFDPLRTWLPVRLRPECDDASLCVEIPPPAAQPPPSPVHDYLARDWRSLRQALVEYLLRRRPGRRPLARRPRDRARGAVRAPRRPAPLPARPRRHGGLPRDGAPAHLGQAARAAGRLRARRRRRRPRPCSTSRCLPGRGGRSQVTDGSVAVDVPGSTLAFTLEDDRTARAALGEIPVYDWGEAGCCLAAGATDACSSGRGLPTPSGAGWLAAGDLLVFEVVDPDDAESPCTAGPRASSPGPRMPAAPTASAGPLAEPRRAGRGAHERRAVRRPAARRGAARCSACAGAPRTRSRAATRSASTPAPARPR